MPAKPKTAGKPAASKDPTGIVDFARQLFLAGMESVTGRATDAWDSLEQAFQDRVAKALGKLGVPTAEEVSRLTKQVESLSKSVEKLAARSSGTKKKPATRRRTAKTAARA